MLTDGYYTALTKDGRPWVPSYSEAVDWDKCTGCGQCVEVCSRDVYVLIEHQGRVVADNPNAGNCVGDGSCARVCPVHALIWQPNQVHGVAMPVVAAESAAAPTERSSTRLHVLGMTWTSCEGTVERALKALPGVVAAQASYPDKLAVVEYDSRKVRLEDLVQVLLQAGFVVSQPWSEDNWTGRRRRIKWETWGEAMVGRVTLSVPGMHWASCENAVRSVLQDTEGVARVQLNSLGRQVMVDYDEERVCQDELIDVLIEAGFMANAV